MIRQEDIERLKAAIREEKEAPSFFDSPTRRQEELEAQLDRLLQRGVFTDA